MNTIQNGFSCPREKQRKNPGKLHLALKYGLTFTC